MNQHQLFDEEHSTPKPKNGVTGDVTGDAKPQPPTPAAESRSPEDSAQSPEPPVYRVIPSSKTARFEGRVSTQLNEDGSQNLSGEFVYDIKKNNRQSKCRQKKERKGQKRVEVWVPAGTQEQIREFAAQLRQEHGIED